MTVRHFLANANRVLSQPRMLMKWLGWQRRHLGWTPQVWVDSRSAIFGFEHFSDYWACSSLLPSCNERSFISRNVAETGLILDVGANLGMFTAVLAGLRPSCVIHSIEPSPTTFSKLRRNVGSSQFQNVKCHEVAFGATVGRVLFFADPLSPATNRFAAGEDEAATDHTFEVSVARLDDFCEDNGIDRIQFLKIDVEGFEADVLTGGARMFTERRIELGLIEVCPGNLFRLGRTIADFLAAISTAGCELRSIEMDGSIGPSMTEEMLRGVSLTNGALVPRHRLAEIL